MLLKVLMIAWVLTIFGGGGVLLEALVCNHCYLGSYIGIIILFIMFYIFIKNIFIL